MRAELSQLLIEGKNAGCSCGWGKNRSDKYTLLLSEYGPLVMLKVPISDIVKKMEKVSSEDMEKKYHSESYRGYYHEALTHGETLPGKLETMKRKASICLDCVRSGNGATPCRFQHE
jgi:hypothetical protein